MQHHSTVWSTSREDTPLHQSLFCGCRAGTKWREEENESIPFTSTPVKLLPIESCASVITRWLFRPLDSPRFDLRQFPVKQVKRIFQSSEQTYKRPYSSWLLPKNGSGPVCTSGRLATQRKEKAVQLSRARGMSTGGREAEPAGPGQSPDSSQDAQCDSVSHYFHLIVMETVTLQTSPTSFRLFQILSPTAFPLSPWHPTAVGVRHCWSHFAGGEMEELKWKLTCLRSQGK